MSQEDPRVYVAKRVDEVRRVLEEIIKFYEGRPSDELSLREREDLARTLEMRLGTLRGLEAYVEGGYVNFSVLRGILWKVEGLTELWRLRSLTASDVVKELSEVIGWLRRIPSSPLQIEVSPAEPPKGRSVAAVVPGGEVYVCITLEETGEGFIASPPLTIGRCASPRSRLAVKEYLSDNPLFVFNSTVCKYGCIKGEIDCTSRKHVHVLYEEGSIVVEHCGNPNVTRTYVISGGRQFTLSKGNRAPLGAEGTIQLSGAYIEGTRLPATLKLALSKQLASSPGRAQGERGFHRPTKKGPVG